MLDALRVDLDCGRAQTKTSLNVPALVIAFAFAAGVGILLGVWPARRAGVLDPIGALQYD